MMPERARRGARRFASRLAVTIISTLPLTAVPCLGAQVAADSALHAAVDGWVERGLTRYGIAGAAVAIVRDGAVVHRRGFGLADVGRAVAVDADTTVFHIASVTKLLTAIAALQQVEQGRLDLHADVRERVGPFRSGGWAGEPVTLHQLLTHTAGIDTRWIGMATTDPTAVRPLAQYLRDEMPARIDAPGNVIRYSNHGYAAIGWLVEDASGEAWAANLERQVLGPLSMTHSYASPRAPRAGAALPYRYRADTTEEPHVYEHAAPGGAVRSTAGDLAKLLVALLDSMSSVPVSPASKRMILESQHTAGRVPGFTYGAFPYPDSRVRAVSMGGEVPGFSTRLLMVPSLRLGVVLMVNRKDPLLALTVFDSVLSRVAPPGARTDGCTAEARDGTGARADIVGAYRSNVHERTSFLKLGALLGPVLTVRADTGSSLVVVNPIDDAAQRWYPAGDSSWTRAGGECLSLVSAGGAPMLAISTKAAGPLMLEPITTATSQGVVISLLLGALLLLLIAFVGESWSWLRHPRPAASRAARGARSLTLALPLAHLGLVTGVGIGLYRLAIEYDDRFAFGLPMWFNAVLVLPYLLAASTVVLAYLLMASRADAGPGRWRSWAVVGASCVLLVIIVNWRVLVL